jgi:hypothetical protein
MNIYFQRIVPYGFIFASGYTLPMSSFYRILCGLNEGVFNIRDIHLWAVENCSVFREREYQVRCSVNVRVGIVGNIVLGHCLLTDRLTIQLLVYHNFLEIVLPGLLEIVPLAVKWTLWFKHDKARALWRIVRQLMHATNPGRWLGRRVLIVWPSWSPDLTAINVIM